MQIQPDKQVSNQTDESHPEHDPALDMSRLREAAYSLPHDISAQWQENGRVQKRDENGYPGVADCALVIRGWAGQAGGRAGKGGKTGVETAWEIRIWCLSESGCCAGASAPRMF